jgi:hypothetical protein
MSTPYLCPHCGTNRSRFNIIEQIVHAVKKDPHNGEIVAEVSPNDPLHYPYRGEKVRVQCGVCGIVEAEDLFIHHAARQQKI